MTRNQIRESMKQKQFEIERLEKEIKELQYQDLLLCDDEQWFTETEQIVKVRENGKLVNQKRLIGKIHWKEGFKDEDTGHVITVERSQPVRFDGQWTY